ncbi:alpha-1,2-mannosyltransferase KTR1 KNAG_0H03360 [Huiozyma naganishii CBS 8797]|uniref:Glycosyltransferase family 15 protein n=1 Tax=Huiozyma naganishii (strain ATCC MYA-139 / BCRC 22969 / CBS 8797 / KCTC 17520 / NBRC 10181 / NCYC 3082 / Yp74L-3) TaxID=1071383 RepID=J7RA48_HUIN7|nr:hypothetical protein KNAG_0H03360 [Kazachstania naganishii CBS 8797]CCK71750.1 hypothetical protein KNAG_0H03360 [Kazachstania naganishii CBS 8797]
MAALIISSDKKNLYKKIAIAVIGLLTFYIVFQGASVSSHGNSVSSTQLSAGNSAVKNAKTGYQYRTVSYPKYTGPKEKATFVTLVRNSDLYSLLPSIKSVEDRFNHKFNYDWVFLNDEEFTDEFKDTVSALVSGTSKFGLIPKEHWSFPSWIDQKKAARVRDQMREDKIIYGDSVSYRHMCRFESGFFYRQSVMDEYDWYWRVEPDVLLHCDIDYDIFKFMRENNKKYGFAISIHEYEATIKSLWKTTRDFMELHPEFVHPNNMMDFISDDNGLSYNMCHFWSNFEIGALDLWRGDAYSAYFDYLDQAGGFFYERWGDAPVHSIAAALFLDRSEIHFFDDVGYFHMPFHSCPLDPEVRLRGKCDCNPASDFTFHGFSCTAKYFTVNDMKKPDGWVNQVDAAL